MLFGTNKLSYNLNYPRFRNSPYIGLHNSLVLRLNVDLSSMNNDC